MINIKPNSPPIPVWALLAIDHKGWPALISYNPKEWWDEIMMGDNFVDVFDAKLPEEPGLYWWHGHFRPNCRAGQPGPNGEIDDWPGEWCGTYTKENIQK